MMRYSGLFQMEIGFHCVVRSVGMTRGRTGLRGDPEILQLSVILAADCEQMFHDSDLKPATSRLPGLQY